MLADYWESAVRGLVKDPDRPISELELRAYIRERNRMALAVAPDLEQEFAGLPMEDASTSTSRWVWPRMSSARMRKTLTSIWSRRVAGYHHGKGAGPGALLSGDPDSG